MKLRVGQALISGVSKVIILEDDNVYTFSEGGPKSVVDILQGCSGTNGLSKKISDLKQKYSYDLVCKESELDSKNIRLLKPLNPPEVWAVGVTYRRQALEHDNDVERKKGKTEALYYYVYDNERAEVFFKGFDRTCVGPSEPITLRADSHQVLPEAEMVLVLGDDGLPIGYTLGNDLTAWDIELECPLYLNQAKIWRGSASIGPYIVPADVFGDPYSCTVKCQVWRNEELVIDSIGDTSGLKRTLEELCYYLTYNNPVPTGTLLFTGTACVIPHDFSLKHNDLVLVSVSGLGNLENTVDKLPPPDWQYPKR